MTQLIDDFNRADGPLGANWSAASASSLPIITSNVMAIDGAVAVASAAYWNPATFGPDVEASAKVAFISTISGQFFKVYVGADTPSASPTGGHSVRVDAVTNNWSLRDERAQVAIAGPTAHPIAVGDEVIIRRVGNRIMALHDDGAGRHVVLTAVVTANLPAAGSYIIFLQWGAGSPWQADEARVENYTGPIEVPTYSAFPKPKLARV